MRALTLTQPWAGLVAAGIKLVENRPRKIVKYADFGKPFAIHASREIDEDVYRRIDELSPGLCQGHKSGGGVSIGDWFHRSRFTSAVIAVATIDAMLDGPQHGIGNWLAPEQHRWYFGPIGYVLRDVRALDEPVPCRGWQGFWTLPPDVAERVEAQLRV